MKNFAKATLASFGLLALAACGHAPRTSSETQELNTAINTAVLDGRGMTCQPSGALSELATYAPGDVEPNAPEIRTNFGKGFYKVCWANNDVRGPTPSA